MPKPLKKKVRVVKGTEEEHTLKVNKCLTQFRERDTMEVISRVGNINERLSEIRAIDRKLCNDIVPIINREIREANRDTSRLEHIEGGVDILARRVRLEMENNALLPFKVEQREQAKALFRSIEGKLFHITQKQPSIFESLGKIVKDTIEAAQKEGDINKLRGMEEQLAVVIKGVKTRDVVEKKKKLNVFKKRGK